MYGNRWYPVVDCARNCRDRWWSEFVLTKATDTMHSFYLQCNIQYLHDRKFTRARGSSSVASPPRPPSRVFHSVCVPGRQRAAFIWKPATYVTSRTLSISTACGLSRIPRLSITVDHQLITPRVQCSRPPRRVVQLLDRDRYTDTNFHSRWRTDAILKIFFGDISASYWPIYTNFGMEVTGRYRSLDQSGNFRKFKMAEGRHFENSFISISQSELSDF